MADKVTRALELAAIIREAEKELAELLGAEPRKRGRPRKKDEASKEASDPAVQ